VVENVKGKMFFNIKQVPEVPIQLLTKISHRCRPLQIRTLVAQLMALVHHEPSSQGRQVEGV